MPNPCLVDNDIVLKVAAYNLGSEVVTALTQGSERPAMLGVGRFVVRQKTKKAKRFVNPEVVAAAIEALLEELQFVEPTDSEIEFAATLEEVALGLGEAFDVGEAQLFAILLQRGCQALVTGDKRAIEAASHLDLAQANGQIVCLEQLFARLLSKVSVEELRKRVCTEPRADRALSICFACMSFDLTQLDIDTVNEGLNSYIAQVRQSSGNLLMGTDDVSALAS